MEDSEIDRTSEAEQYHLKAQFILHELQANKQVYGSNSALAGANPANVDLALQYINRSLEIDSDNPVFLNLKALLLWEGKGNKDEAIPLLERAAELNPRDIDIQNNLNAIKTSQCIVATAAFGTPLASEVNTLRLWRDNVLKKSTLGRLFVSIYYTVSPPIARLVARSIFLRGITRGVLRPIVHCVKSKL
ncbi:tetratricopeptide repeat protein [Shewanella sp.]|uniref:tetratricopeptide repeat protein n=1 Tax=Shewanella sp. TaxID=50422 RepID=UPI003A978C21